jgi:hypothetical protein
LQVAACLESLDCLGRGGHLYEQLEKEKWGGLVGGGELKRVGDRRVLGTKRARKSRTRFWGTS